MGNRPLLSTKNLHNMFIIHGLILKSSYIIKAQMTTITTRQELAKTLQQIMNQCAPSLAATTAVVLQNRDDNEVHDGLAITSSLPVKIRVFGMKEAKGIEGIYDSMDQLRIKIETYCARYGKYRPDFFRIDLGSKSVDYGKGRLNNFGKVEYLIGHVVA